MLRAMSAFFYNVHDVRRMNFLISISHDRFYANAKQRQQQNAIVAVVSASVLVVVGVINLSATFTIDYATILRLFTIAGSQPNTFGTLLAVFCVLNNCKDKKCVQSEN